MTRLRPIGWPVIAAAAISVAAWLVLGPRLASPLGDHYGTALEAARNMQRAMALLAVDKQALGLMQDRELDPNQTGLIGPELTSLVTTYGALGSKRTATNPDLAAAIVGLLARNGITGGDTVLVTLSGSLVGANVAVLVALEALGVTTLVIDSVGGSMYGAVDASYTWLDMHSSLIGSNLLSTGPIFAVMGGYDAIGIGLEGTDEVRAAAARNDVRLIDADSLAGLVEAARDEISSVVDPAAISMLINVGGGMLAMGNCLELTGLESVVSYTPVTCREGTPGLITSLSELDIPVMHIINMRFLALELGLPYDPIPLPTPGNNKQVYGPPPENTAQGRDQSASGRHVNFGGNTS